MKTKIEVRAKALELAVTFCKGITMSDEIALRCAKNFEPYLLGDVDIPECEPSAEVMMRRMMPSITALYNEIKTDAIKDSAAMSIEGESLQNH